MIKRKDPSMKTLSSVTRAPLLAALALTMIGAQAQAAEPATEPVSRALVRAELEQAQAAGEIASPGDLYAPVRLAMLEAQRTHRALAEAAKARRLAASAAPLPASAPR
jgi:hypothetical protein